MHLARTNLLKYALIFSLTSIILFSAFIVYTAYKPQQPEPVRIFQIGYNKAGTTTLSDFFNANGIASLHNDDGELAYDIYKNHINNQPLISNKYKNIVGFFDVTRYFNVKKQQEKWIEIGQLLFKELDQQYPNSKFILNTRNKEAWLKSRSKMPWLYKDIKITLLDYAAQIHNMTHEQVLAMWSKEWDDHHQAVLEYFKDRPNDLLVFNIETEGPDKLVDFFRGIYALDPSLYEHKNKTSS